MENTQQHDWRRRLEIDLKGMEARVVEFCDPLPEDRSMPRSRKRDKYWFSSFVSELMHADYCLREGERQGESVEEFRSRFDSTLDHAKTCAAKHRDRIRREYLANLAEYVDKYHSLYWIEAIEADLSHELWYTLYQRDIIEALLHWAKLILPTLIPPKKYLNNVSEADLALRKDGPRLWSIDPALGIESAERNKFKPREHWWWWLDHSEQQ